jgi:hypothetical protein
MKSSPALSRRQFGLSDVEIRSQAVVFPIIMCYIREREWHYGFSGQDDASTFFRFELNGRARPRDVVGPFCFSGLRFDPASRLRHSSQRTIGRRQKTVSPCESTPGGLTPFNLSFSVGQIPGRSRVTARTTALTPTHRPAQHVVHPEALFGIVDPLDASSDHNDFFNPNPARAPQGGSPSPAPSPLRGKGPNSSQMIQGLPHTNNTTTPQIKGFSRMKSKSPLKPKLSKKGETQNAHVN